MGQVLGIILVLVVVGVGGYFGYQRFVAGDTQSNTKDTPYTLPALTKNYTNSDYGFSLKMPEGFEARTIHDDASGSESIMLEGSRDSANSTTSTDSVQAGSGPVGIQILITPFDEDIVVLDAARIHQDLPALSITDEQVVEVGPTNKGLAFKSDNDAFGGASREVWFVYKGHLYQISTYQRLDSLLQAIFGTWEFM